MGIQNWTIKYKYEIFATIGTIVILWQLLLPGYVLTWDLVWGPLHTFPEFSGFVNTAPLRLVIYAAGFVLPMCMIEKVLLVGLFFLLFYLPIRFFPFKINEWARYAAATFYAVNPFVYERLLAGQLGVLFGYALLPPFIYFLLRFVMWGHPVSPHWKDAVYLGLSMLLIGAFSLHTFVMAVVVAIFVLGVGALTKMWRHPVSLHLKNAAIAAGVVAVGSLYWVLPFLLAKQSSPLRAFDASHWTAFATSADPLFGTLGNVLALYGFWGEAYPWMQTLLSPKDIPIIFYPALLILATLIVTGAVRLLREHKQQSKALLLIGIGTAAFIFSVGLAPTILQDINFWLFEHVPFWRGFRDTGKWSMWLALIYAYFFAAGASYTLQSLRPKLQSIAKYFFILLPLAYTFTLPLALAGQLKPVQYPASWQEANALLAQDTGCKAIFLPWHQYYELDFNNGFLTVSPASRYFNCEILSSADAEIGGVGHASDKSPDYYSIAGAIASNTNDPDATVHFLKSKGIKYIIYTPDIAGEDIYDYPFLKSTLLRKIIDTPSLTLFALDL